MSFFRYPGGKKKIKNIIINKLLEYSNDEITQYSEPFFGGGSIGLSFLSQASHIKNVWLNDKDIALSCLWTSLIKYPMDLIDMVDNFNPSVEGFYSIKEELLDLKEYPKTKEDVLNLAIKKLGIHQISFSGLGPKSGGPLGGKEQKSKYNIDCRWSPNHIKKKILSYSNLLSKYDVVDNQCSNLDFQEMIDDSNKSLIYLDPPYYIKGNELYQFGFTIDDHLRLMNSLKNTNHVWLLSYDDCPEIRELYSWAKIEEINVNYSISKATKKGELLISKK